MKLEVLFPWIAGIVVSLALTYFPSLKTWYAKFSNAQKALILLAISLVVALAYFGLGCSSWAAHLGIVVTCTSDGAWTIANAFWQIVVSSQATYLLTPTQPAPVASPVTPPAK
jgi:hypothetical protein